MTAAEDLSEGLYLKLIDHISTLLKALARGADDPSLASAQAEAQSKLQEIEQALTNAINELKDNAEHKTFTVAFYGETNAGKSTLIETLRILLRENTKREQRHCFLALQQSGLSEEALQALETEIESLDSRLAQAESETAAVDARIVKIQAGLKAFGNDGIQLDGVVGAQTSAAIREFQSLFGLPVTGAPDEAVYAKMREIGLTN